ncbi:unnamed protein product [Symbiodinium natans]|uniref:RRM domain-containing protein n=1 Tax=Symbiodinium natans TaxID=878477 RepID=A0A812P5F9_9DINO|nr:unnamed protein product [Symbiodinium natans]
MPGARHMDAPRTRAPAPWGKWALVCLAAAVARSCQTPSFLQPTGSGPVVDSAVVRRVVQAPTEDSVKSHRWRQPRPPLVPMLFETFNVSDETDVKAVAGYMSAVLAEDDHRIVDMKMMSAKARSKALYILAYINAKEARATAQILPRQRDGRCRLRVIRDFPVTEDVAPAVLRVGSNTNSTALANLIAYRLRAVDKLEGGSRANTVKPPTLPTAALFWGQFELFIEVLRPQTHLTGSGIWG